MPQLHWVITSLVIEAINLGMKKENKKRINTTAIYRFMMRLILLILFFILTNPIITKAQDPEKQTPASDGVEFMSFIFNETITKIGSDFFRMFNTDWENPTDLESLSIYIGERPMPGMGTQIWVRVEDRFTFMSFVRPSEQQLREAVQTALRQTEAYFLNYEMIQKQLESDDFKGTGIF